MSLMERIYQRLPVWGQSLAVNLEGWRVCRRRYGPAFQQALAAAEARWSDPTAVLAWQKQGLTAQLSSAASGVPYWCAAIAATGVDPVSDPYACLARLPILSKAEVRARPADFVDPVAATSAATAHTSGTTGAGLRFPVSRAADAAQWATWWRYRRWHGITADTWCAYFGGRSLVPLEQRTPPFWRVNHPGRQVMFSGYHFNEHNAVLYLAEIKRRRLPWIHGYPSLVALLAQYALATGFRDHALRWISTGAESLLPQQRAVIEQAFGVRPIQHYGMAEGVANISECRAGRLHVDEDFALVEFVPDASGALRIIGTALHNRAFPLLRYDVGDLATLAAAPCGCGFPGRTIETIDGRIEDYLLTRDGRRIGRLDHVFKDQVLVREAQIRQQQAGVCEVLLVVDARFGAAEQAALEREFYTRVGDGVSATFTRVEGIPRTRSGKLRLVVSTVGKIDMDS